MKTVGIQDVNFESGHEKLHDRDNIMVISYGDDTLVNRVYLDLECDRELYDAMLLRGIAVRGTPIDRIDIRLYQTPDKRLNQKLLGEIVCVYSDEKKFMYRYQYTGKLEKKLMDVYSMEMDIHEKEI